MSHSPVLSLLETLVSTPSVNPALHGGGDPRSAGPAVTGEARVAGVCADRLREAGFAVDLHEVAPGRPNVVARHGAGDPVFVLNGHTDTVGVEGMRVAPFTPTRRGGRLYGRGSCDMKAGLACLIEAARRVATAGHPGTLVVALTCDEEHASMGMAALVGRGLRAHGAVVCEPTGLAVMPAHKGFAWIEVEFRGRAAHGSRPEVGVDAVRHAAAFVRALDDLEAELARRPAHPLLGHGSVHVGTIRGGTAPSVYPDRCTVVVERRTLPGEGGPAVLAEAEALLDEVRRAIPELNATARLGLVRPGTEVPGEHPLVASFGAALARRGLPAEARGMSAWVDAALLNEAGVPAVCFGPGSIVHAHAADESVEVDQLEPCTEILVEVVGRALGAGSATRPVSGDPA